MRQLHIICWKLELTRMMIKDSIRNKDDLSAGDFLGYFERTVAELAQMLPDNTEEQTDEIRQMTTDQLSESGLFSAEILEIIQKK